VSSLHGLGVAEVLDEIVELLPEGGVEAAADAALPIAIIGRPNVGKSALLNAILGEERVIVSSVPGTTRDAIDTPFTFEGRDLVLIDTAGLRRRGRIERGVEKHAAMRSQRALARAQVALCVFDLLEGFTAQDTHVAGYAIEEVRGLIIVANKWDLVRERDWTEEHWTHFLRGRLRFAPWASIRFTSAAECEGIGSVLAEAVRIGEERKRRVETALLNQTIRRAVASKPPPAPSKGGRVKLLYVTQAAIEPPTFVFFLNDASLAHFGYRRYMENVIRRNFGFEGTAIALTFRSRSEEM
jgi:GTP-binding protein